MLIQFTYTNQLMDECLQELEGYWPDEKKPDGDALRFASLILADIVCHQRCYLLRSKSADWKVIPDGEFIPDHTIPDCSGYEDFANHFHVSEFVTSNEPGIGYLGIGIALVELLHMKLHLSFPAIHFRISIGFPVKPLDEKDTFTRNDCRISFHAIREGENIFDNLTGFQHDAVGILEF